MYRDIIDAVVEVPRVGTPKRVLSVRTHPDPNPKQNLFWSFDTA